MKRTIYLNPTTAALLDVENEANLSARVALLAQAMADACDALQIPRDEADAMRPALLRYRAILAEAMPALDENEWALLCDILNGSDRSAWSTGLDPARSLAMSVIDSGADGSGDKWGVDLADLVARLAALPYAAQCAVIDVVDRFWQHAGNSLAPIGQQLAAAGARMSASTRSGQASGQTSGE